MSNMKPILIGTFLAIILTIATTGFAADFNINGCTQDSQKAVLTLDLREEASADIKAEIRAAFVKTAARLTADDLINGTGFQVFVSYLTEEAWSYIQGIQGPPILDGTCN